MFKFYIQLSWSIDGSAYASSRHFNNFPNCNLETWEGYFACCERTQQAGTWEVRTDEILIWAYMGRKEEQMERWRSLASKEDPAISIHGMVWGSLDGESD